ncbi:winged helix-turn-helix domain-containing protein [Streptomyces sp. NPDC097727]|uniref:winged helix-turn-helix domain-containing protein n=1 Tax=Streptomyces sp. NPDC097727 TaxID=3366092 RepID=UPI0038054934
MAHGWPTPHWTLDRIRVLISCRFGPHYTVQGVAALLKRHGWVRRPQRQARAESATGWVGPRTGR